MIGWNLKVWLLVSENNDGEKFGKCFWFDITDIYVLISENLDMGSLVRFGKDYGTVLLQSPSKH